MSSTTENLDLFEYDPQTDGAQTFNIQTALNNNFNKIDTAVGKPSTLSTTEKGSLVGAVNEVNTKVGSINNWNIEYQSECLSFSQATSNNE